MTTLNNTDKLYLRNDLLQHTQHKTYYIALNTKKSFSLSFFKIIFTFISLTITLSLSLT